MNSRASTSEEEVNEAIESETEVTVETDKES